MKILINKKVPQVRIIAPEIIKRKDIPGGFEVPFKDNYGEDFSFFFSKDLWKLKTIKPIDLEKEICSFIEDEFALSSFPELLNDTYSWKDIKATIKVTAKYFYKLGKSVTDGSKLDT